MQNNNWTDWQWQLANSIKTADQLADFTDLSTKKLKEIQQVISKRYQNGKDQMRLTPYLLSLIDFSDPKDPIALQHLPSLEETQKDNFNFERVWEIKKDFLDGQNRLIHQKYPDVILLRVTNTCNAFCRFCFQKERTIRSGVGTILNEKKIAEAIKIINSKKEVRQILLSGGDPLILKDAQIKKILEKLIKVAHLKTIRINTRSLLHNPFRITKDFAAMLGYLQEKSWDLSQKGKQIKIGVHFNHPSELTKEAIAAIRTLQKNNIAIYNQTVLLKEINDNLPTLKKLFRKLREEGVELHYLSHAMPVPGTSHFRTKVGKGHELLTKLHQTKEFRGQLPHYEMSHHTGKQLSTKMTDRFYEKKVKNKNYIKFMSDVSEKWEIYPDA